MWIWTDATWVFVDDRAAVPGNELFIMGGGDCRLTVADGWTEGADYATPAINGPASYNTRGWFEWSKFSRQKCCQSLHKST